MCECTVPWALGSSPRHPLPGRQPSTERKRFSELHHGLSLTRELQWAEGAAPPSHSLLVATLKQRPLLLVILPMPLRFRSACERCRPKALQQRMAPLPLPGSVLPQTSRPWCPPPPLSPPEGLALARHMRQMQVWPRHCCPTQQLDVQRVSVGARRCD